MLKCIRCESMNIRSISTRIETNQREINIFYHECCDCGHKNKKKFTRDKSLKELYDEIEDLNGLGLRDVLAMMETCDE